MRFLEDFARVNFATVCRHMMVAEPAGCSSPLIPVLFEREFLPACHSSRSWTYFRSA